MWRMLTNRTTSQLVCGKLTKGSEAAEEKCRQVLLRNLKLYNRNSGGQDTPTQHGYHGKYGSSEKKEWSCTHLGVCIDCQRHPSLLIGTWDRTACKAAGVPALAEFTFWWGETNQHHLNKTIPDDMDRDCRVGGEGRLFFYKMLMISFSKGDIWAEIWRRGVKSR